MRLVAFFVRHVALVRPVSDQGKLRLAHDMAQFEMALAPLGDMKQSGVHYKYLRALRPLLFKETPEEISASTEVWKHPRTYTLSLSLR